MKYGIGNNESGIQKKRHHVVNLIVFVVLLVALGILGFFTYQTNQNFKKLNSDLKAELKQTQNDLDFKIDQWDNKIVKLREEGYVELDDFSDISKNVLAATVAVASKQDLQNFGSGELTAPAEDLATGFGSGFLVSSDGLVVTAKHVLDAIGDEVAVRTSNGQILSAEVVARHDTADVALLKIGGSDYPFIALGYFENFEAGEQVGLSGFSSGFTKPLIHRGVVSAKGLVSGVQIFTVNAFINQGNSGGPIFSAITGRVLGVINARKRDVSSEKFLDREQFSSGVSLGGRDPIQTSVDLYNETLKVVGEVSQIGIGFAASIDEARELINGYNR